MDDALITNQPSHKTIQHVHHCLCKLANPNLWYLQYKFFFETLSKVLIVELITDHGNFKPLSKLANPKSWYLNFQSPLVLKDR
mmetsp:Transcript_4731/g.8472  ORF Transcript_4731/g.8472 Transcript_4731/m.8472 type:complete len:83 (-) Transcript_4731:22-270(-)